MPVLLLISLQIIYYCLTWALLTQQIHPIYNFIEFFSQNVNNQIPDWSIHTNYLLSVIFLSSALSITFRLKVMKNMIDLSIPFLIIVWLAFSAQPTHFLINLPKYAFFVLIPSLFRKILENDTKNITLIVKGTISLSLFYVPFGIAYFLLDNMGFTYSLTIIIISAVVIASFLTAIGLFYKQTYSKSLQAAEFLFFIVVADDLLKLFRHPSDFNQLSLILIGVGLVIFTRWVRVLHTIESTQE